MAVIALGITLALTLAHEVRVGIGEIDLLVGLGRFLGWLGRRAFRGTFALGARFHLRAGLVHLREQLRAPRDFRGQLLRVLIFAIRRFRLLQKLGHIAPQLRAQLARRGGGGE